MASARPATRPICHSTAPSGDKVCRYFAGSGSFNRYCFHHTKPRPDLWTPWAPCAPAVEQCNVCLEEMPVQFRTSCCRKAYCLPCLVKHSKSDGPAAARCPTCREPMALAHGSAVFLLRNLKFRARHLRTAVHAAGFLASKETLDAHMQALMAAEKARREAAAKQQYDDALAAIDERHTAVLRHWTTNADKCKDCMWDRRMRVVEGIACVDQCAAYAGHAKTRTAARAGHVSIAFTEYALDLLTPTVPFCLGSYHSDDEDGSTDDEDDDDEDEDESDDDE